MDPIEPDPLAGAHALALRGEHLWLLPSRALWWPAAGTLCLADLHWGKDETFRRQGIPLPAGLLADELARLRHLLQALRPTTVLVLGDLVHGASGLSPAVVETASAIFQAIDTHWLLVEGNHDRPVRLPEAWPLSVVEEPYGLGPFAFSHHPGLTAERFLWSGHIHPTADIGAGADRLRLPCFLVGERQGLLPAWHGFSNGLRQERGAGARYVIGEGRVWPLDGPT